MSGRIFAFTASGTSFQLSGDGVFSAEKLGLTPINSFDFYSMGGTLDIPLNAFFIRIFASRYLPNPRCVNWKQIRSIDIYNYVYAHQRLFYSINDRAISTKERDTPLKKIPDADVIKYIEEQDCLLSPNDIDTGAPDRYNLQALLRQDVIDIRNRRILESGNDTPLGSKEILSANDVDLSSVQSFVSQSPDARRAHRFFQKLLFWRKKNNVDDFSADIDDSDS